MSALGEKHHLHNPEQYQLFVLRNTRTKSELDGHCAFWIQNWFVRSNSEQNCLNADIKCWDIESLKHDLGHLLTIALGIHGCLCEKHGVILRCNSQFIKESVMPDLLHVVPVGHDAVLNWILGEREIFSENQANSHTLMNKIPLLACASSPMYASFFAVPIIALSVFGRPTMEGKTQRGAGKRLFQNWSNLGSTPSSPANPALTIPEPLSQTKACCSISSAILECDCVANSFQPKDLDGYFQL